MTATMVEGTVERRIGDKVVRIVRDDITGMEVRASTRRPCSLTPRSFRWALSLN